VRVPDPNDPADLEAAREAGYEFGKRGDGTPAEAPAKEPATA
jgi:hypothetical protein